jgi:2-hydroxymuconate-semialdehyde hydrolase
MPNIGERKFITTNSFNIAYRQWGSHGKPIVLLHGIPMNSSLWNLTGIELAKQNYTVYAPEMLGLGYTEGPIDYDHSLEGQSRLIEVFCREVVGDNYILAGHDLGGGVAQIMIANSPHDIRKCVLTNCVAFDSWPPGPMESLVKQSQQDSYPDIFKYDFIAGFIKKALFVNLTNQSLITVDLIEDILNGMAGSGERVEHFIRFLRAMNNECTQKASPRLADYKKPLLLVWGKGDQFQPLSVGERLRELVPESNWVTIDGKHFHPFESTILAEKIQSWDFSAESPESV